MDDISGKQPRTIGAQDVPIYQSEDAPPPGRADKRAIRTFDASELEGRPIPQRRWHVDQLIPAGTVTLLSGDGGLGKTQLVLQLGCATVLGRHWLGRNVAQGRAMIVTAEDSADELHRRLADIAADEGVSFRELDGLMVAPLAGEDVFLASATSRGKLKTSLFFNSIMVALSRREYRLLVLDPLSDLFAGDENNRSEARQFITLLRGLAIRHQLAVVLTSHPSLSGMSSRSGTSGSTAWSASVRSRLYLELPSGDPKKIDPDARILRVMKANYAARGVEISLRWRRGVFVHDQSIEAIQTREPTRIANAKAETVFLDLVSSYLADGRNLSATPSANYAPTILSRDERASGVSRTALTDAMNRLFAAKKIQISEVGPPTRRLKRIEICEVLAP